MVEVGACVFMGGLEDRDLLEETKRRFEKHRRFKKVIELQIDKPK